MLVLLLTFLASVSGCWLIVHRMVRSTPRQNLILLEAQSPHALHVSRLGGIPVFLSWLIGLVMMEMSDFPAQAKLGFGLSIVALPVVMAGFIEDYLMPVRPRWRMFAGAISAGLAILFMNLEVARLDIPWFDLMLIEWPILAIALTLFAVAGLVNSFNIIDGLHGQSVGSGILTLLGLLWVASLANDMWVLWSASIAIASLAGFFVLNYPKGLIFLGDGGAYWIGFLVAELSLALVLQQPAVSPWCPLVLCLYPITETLVTIARRICQRRSVMSPDRDHLHQLLEFAISQRYGCSAAGCGHLAAPWLWLASLISVAMGIMYWNNTSVLQWCALTYLLAYMMVYFLLKRLVCNGEANAKP